MSDQPQNEAEAHEFEDTEPRPPSIRDLNAPLIVTIGVVSVLLLIVAVVGTEAWFRYEMHQERQQKVVNQPFTELQQLNEQQRQILTGPPQWQDRENGLVSVPIDQAMETLIQQREQTAGSG
jgi:hypothetical protein